MAKKRTRTRKLQADKKSASISWGGSAAKGTRNWNIAIGLGAALMVAGGAWWWWQGRQIQSTFLALAERGTSALNTVETTANDGRKHLQSGTTHTYSTLFPTSGSHATTWTTPGFYQQEQPPTLLVHALEHGNIVIYYDRPDDTTLDILKDWASLYTGQWDGVVVTPSPGLGPGIVLTAWRRILEMDTFDPAQAAAFIDAFRGRGPERAVR